jgi:pre-mRNA-splicing factor ISY1
MSARATSRCAIAAGLGEARIRDLNDEINKLVREKGHWERQIKVLGGPDYAEVAQKSFEAEGKLAPGSGRASASGGGYKYYGAAKDLPGVRELFEGAAKEKPRRTRAQIMKAITPDYYGYRDEDDGVLVAVEAAAERELVAHAVAEWERGRAARKRQRVEGGATTAISGGAEMDVDFDGEDGAAAVGAVGAGAAGSAGGVAGAPAFRAHVVVPSQKEIEALLVEKKKQLLLAKYASDQLQEEQQQAKSLVRGGAGGAASRTG